jgi:hypothetical protein
MTPTAIYSCTAILALGFFACGKALHARLQTRVVQPLLVLCALPWCLGMAYYAHLFDRPWYYEWRSWRVTDLLMSLFALPLAFAFARKDGHTRRRGPLKRFLLGPLLAVACVLAVFAKPLLIPLRLDPLATNWRDDVCLQSTQASCGPCATATILRTLGVQVEEAQLAGEAQTAMTGTLNWLLLRALRDRGLQATLLEPRAPSEVAPPAVLGVTLGEGGAGHFVAYLANTGQGFVVGDPLEGRLVLDEEQFNEKYRFGNFALKISR